MVTIAHITENIVSRKPFLQEALAKGIINYGALADEILPVVESVLKKKVKHSAVMMALRRYADKLNKSFIAQLKIKGKAQIIIKSGIFELTVVKNQQNYNLLKKIQNLISPEKGDLLNLTQGNTEITIISNIKYYEKILKLFKPKDIVHKKTGISALTIFFSKDFILTPGFYYLILRELAWENINVFEMVSTSTELTLLLNNSDVGNAFNIINEIINDRANDK